MAAYTIAYTAPINQDQFESKLTQDQVWTYIDLKAHHAEKFTPTITSSEILQASEDCDFFTRQVYFAPDSHPMGLTVAVENRWLYQPCWVKYRTDDRRNIVDMISTGSAGELLYTSVVEWRHPNIRPNSIAAKDKEKEDRDTTIATMHRMAQDTKETK
ncbi:DUF1857-domain-containing protein [Hypoxylon trugodes]|uniref:DUF1857-domain-containing protein n=1 Tax=Hypoxylon trugodes TaxID=326681 RepID=UPI00219E959A|nr:DUF1857-domain-containing protein [Hypoxylon trugodes]KAI1385749.1 DUF1857-domain-containing protein [Hypoxylon trugodes]